MFTSLTLKGKIVLVHSEDLPHTDHAVSSVSSRLPFMGNVLMQQTQFNLKAFFTSHQN